MFKVDDKVKGMIKVYDALTEDYPEENNTEYSGEVVYDHKDGSYSVKTKTGEVLVELYFDETMELINE